MKDAHPGKRAFRWDIFLSYSSKDRVTVQKIQRFLESFNLPDGEKLRVFRDETDIRSGDLTTELKEALRESRCLAVCCSHASIESNWVQEEISFFKEISSERPIVPLVLSDSISSVLPSSLTADTTRYSDLTDGWRLGSPKKNTRTELIRLVATASDSDFRELLPIDALRRKKIRNRSITSIAATALGVLAWPVETWIDITPEEMGIMGCDSNDAGVMLFNVAPEYASKSLFTIVRLDPSGKVASVDQEFGPHIDLRGRLLPARHFRYPECGDTRSWTGKPNGVDCMVVRATDEPIEFYDQSGGTEATGTEIYFGNAGPELISRPWNPIDDTQWQMLGYRLSPSAGIPVSSRGQDVWLGMPATEFSPSVFLRSTNGGENWSSLGDFSDVQSVRHLEIGVLIAGKFAGNLGFFLAAGESFLEYEAPKVGETLEVCGELGSNPVVRVDQSVYVRGRKLRVLL